MIYFILFIYIIYSSFSLLVIFYLRSRILLTNVESPLASWVAELPSFVRALENELFLESSSEKEYLNEATLYERMKSVVSKNRQQNRTFRLSRKDVETMMINEYTRIKECLSKYADVMSHSLTCEALGRCSENDDCSGMKYLMKHHAECVIVDCKTCKTMSAIRDLVKKI